MKISLNDWLFENFEVRHFITFYVFYGFIDFTFVDTLA